MALLTAAITATTAAATDVHKYVGVALSPDGTQIADLESGGSSQSPQGVVVRDADGKVVVTFDPCKTCSYADPAWSPDGESLAFTGWDTKTRTGFLWVAEGQTLHPVASFDGLLAKPRYSPDGKTLAVLATEHPSLEEGANGPHPAQVGDLDAQPIDVQRIAVFEPSAPDLRQVSPADRYVYDYDWTPDGRSFVTIDATGDPDNEWYVAKLEAVDLATGAARTIAAPTMQISYPRVSTDGKTVTFIGGLMSDYEPAGGDIWAVPLAGGEPRNLTPGYKGTFNSAQWRQGKLYATAVVFDRFAVFAMAKDGDLKSLWSDQNTILAGDGRISLSADGARMATMLHGFMVAPRIVVGRLSAPHPITHENDRIVANTDARSISWTNEGLTLQGWLLAPKNLQPGKTYPMAVYIHGGPSHFQESRFQWDSDIHDLLERGYFVFEPNYRGSFGQGDAFTRANVQDFGGGDLRDILAGVDAVEKVAPIDDNRLAVFGHSYGGFMTMWTVTQTDRFKAATVSAGISDWVSYYGQTNAEKWVPLFFGGSPYDHPALYDRLSPIRAIKQAKTPTFIFVGDLDLGCPPAQAIEFWHALKAEGVPTSLVIYPGEGHGLRKLENDQDATARMIAWFDNYVRGGQQALRAH